MRKMTALETSAEIRKAQRDWFKAFRAGAEKVGHWDAPIYWHDGQRVWGGFSERTRRKGVLRTVEPVRAAAERLRSYDPYSGQSARQRKESEPPGAVRV